MYSLLSVVAVIACAEAFIFSRIPSECVKCRLGEKCVKTYTTCVRAPCPQYKCVAEKPGKCPAPVLNFGICVVKCHYDDDCPGIKKCCGSCPRQCQAPHLPNPCGRKCRRGYACVANVVFCVRQPCPPLYHCVSTRPKRGDCPMVSPEGLEGAFECEYDSQCPGKTKCCARMCMQASNGPVVE